MTNLNILSFDVLTEKIKSIKENFSASIQERIKPLLEQKEYLLLEFKETASTLSFEAIQDKMAQIQKIDLEIVKIKASTPDDIKPQVLFLFDDQLYYNRKNTTGRVRNSNGYKFADSDKVMMKHGEHVSEIYTVIHEEGKNQRVKDSNGKQFSPSKLTELFHTQVLNKPLSKDSKGMAGLSHNYWVKAE